MGQGTRSSANGVPVAPGILSGEPLTMSSLEIAELTGKRHKHVLDDIRKMLAELGFHSAEFSAQYRDSTGRSLPLFNLPKRETMILVSGYSVTLRARIVDRWQELEAQVAAPKPALPDFTNPVIATRAWADGPVHRRPCDAGCF